MITKVTDMIVWYEDEPQFVDSYAEVIREHGYDLVFFSNIKDLLNFVTIKIDTIKLFIIDIMVFNPDDVDGKVSGLKLITELSEIYAKQNKQFKSKIIVFTNCTGDSFYSTFGMPGVKKTLRKADVLPSQLLSIIESLIKA